MRNELVGLTLHVHFGDCDVLTNGDRLLADGTAKLGLKLPELVASCAVWANPEVFQALKAFNQDGVWFPNTRRARADEKRRSVVDGITLDDNTMANLAIKNAVFGSRVKPTRYHVCHIWPKTCYEPRYHTCIANLVLVPAAISSLTDHDPDVVACLQYRAFELYGWHPVEFPPPTKPTDYPAVWIDPLPVSDDVRRGVKRLEAAVFAQSAAGVEPSQPDMQANDDLVGRILHTVASPINAVFEKVDRRRFREAGGDRRVVILTASRRSNGQYIFDVYHEQLNFCGQGPSLLAFALTERDRFYVLSSPFQCTPLRLIRTDANAKTGKQYRRVVFREMADGSLTTGSAQLDGSLEHGIIGMPQFFGL